MELRKSGVVVDMAYGDRGLKGGMKAADKSGANFGLVVGDDELSSKLVKIKDMKSGEFISSTLTPSAISSFLAKIARD
jgi:histidyl-tRNA synthetase